MINFSDPDFCPQDYAASITQRERDKARLFLLDHLIHGPMTTTELFADADYLGVDMPALRYAKAKLHILALRDGARWWWRLPNDLDIFFLTREQEWCHACTCHRDTP